MCKTKMAGNASEPRSAGRASSRPSSTRSPRNPPAADSSTRPSSTRNPTASNSNSSSSGAASYPSTSGGGGTSSFTHATSSVSSHTSLSSLRESISQNPHIYDVAEIRAATNNFLAKPYSSSSAKCWRCALRGADTIIFQRKLRRRLTNGEVKRRLAVIGRSHHVSLVKLLGAAVSGDHIYLVYEFVPGANLSDCLRNRINPNFSVLSTWTSRIQIAADVAHALDYIHHKTGLNLTLVHNHIKSSGIIVTDPALNARICHFGAAYLCGDVLEPEAADAKGNQDERETTRELSFEGVRGYMAPEFQRAGVPTQESDVYAFGVVILELVSGEEPLKYRFGRGRGDFVRTSVIETAREAMEEGEARMRRWVDRKLRDSFPVEVAEKLVRLALECVHVDPGQRPGMGRVAGKVSKLFLESQAWSDRIRVPHDQISVSLAPR